jgi:hypothetical protein
MATVGDTVTYVHGKNDNPFFDDVGEHEATLLAMIVETNMADLAILNKDGNPTIPISGVRHKEDKDRNEDSAYWV